MKAKVIYEQGGQRTIAVVLDKGDEFVSTLTSFAREQKLTGSRFTALGAFSSATLGYFDRAKLDYKQIRLDEQVEVLTLVGNIAMDGDEPKVHAHVVVGRPDSTTRGGHVMEAWVWPTLEAVVVEEPAHLRRKTDRATGLALIDLGLMGD